MKPRELIHLLENPDAPKTVVLDEHTEILLTLLVHMFFVDKRLDEREVALMQRILPEGQDVQKYLDTLSQRPLDLEKLGKLYPDAADRDDIVTLAEHAVWGDDEVDPREWDLVDKLVEALGVVRD